MVGSVKALDWINVCGLLNLPQSADETTREMCSGITLLHWYYCQFIFVLIRILRFPHHLVSALLITYFPVLLFFLSFSLKASLNKACEAHYSIFIHLTKASDIVNPVAMWMAERYCHRKKFVRGSTFSMMGWQGRSSAECTHQLPWVSLRNGTSCLPQIPPGRFPLCR